MPSCVYCDQEFDEVAELTAHLTEVHGLAKHFPCKVCFKLFAHRSNMARHMKIHQRPTQYTFHPCNVCGKKFLSQETANKHAAMHGLSQTFHCPHCNKIFFKAEGLRNHVCNPGGQSDDSNDCPSCNFPYTKGHECQYREDGSRIIFIGNKVPTTKKKKKSQHRSGRMYKCKYCVATFASCYSHNSHMKTHTAAYKAKSNVILSVPSFQQPHYVEVKAEPLEASPGDVDREPSGGNGFAWMHPQNLEVNNAADNDRTKSHPENQTGDEMSCNMSKSDLMGNCSIETSPGEESRGAEDPYKVAMHQKSKQVDGARCETSDCMEGTVPLELDPMGLQLQEMSTLLNKSDFVMVQPQETESVSNTLNKSDFIGTQLQEIEGICANSNKTASVTSSLFNKSNIMVNPQETESVASPNKSDILRVNPQETESLTSSNKSDFLRVCPQEPENVTSPNKSDLIRINPKVIESVSGTSPNKIDSRVNAQETESRTSPNKSDFIRVRSQETLCVVSRTSHDAGSHTQHAGVFTMAPPREPEPCDWRGGGMSGSGKVARSFPPTDLNCGGARFTEPCPEGSQPLTYNHSQERGPFSYYAPSYPPQALRDRDEVYDCNICGKAFSTPEELTTHVRWHNDPKKMPFKCPFCERGFVNSPAVYQHVLMNHKEQRY